MLVLGSFRLRGKWEGDGVYIVVVVLASALFDWALFLCFWYLLQ